MDATDDGASPDELAERLFELREEKKYVEGQIEAVSERLVQALGEGTKTTLGAIEVRVAHARTSLRVTQEGDVPTEFLSPKPDRKRILAHIEATGDIPPGVELSEGRATVFTKSTKAD